MTENKTMLIGRLTDNLTLQKGSNETVFVRFTLAINKKGKNKNTDWIPCVAFNKLAELMHQMLKKGSLISVEGHLQSSQYTKDDKTSYSLDCVIEDFMALEPKEKEVQEA